MGMEMKMKLGTQTASFVNYLMSGTNGQPEVSVGMGATILGWTDRHPATIVEVQKGGKIVVVQKDHAKRIDNNGMSESQDYEFTPNPEATRCYYKQDKNGAYRSAYFNESGRLVFGSGQLRVGERDKYHDFSF
jgi:hypothetical protein